jgi:nucleotide-binding universal stress UspA family protein
MHRSILVNQDVSDESRQALDLAIWLADAANAHIHLAHYHPHKLPLLANESREQVDALLGERAAICDRAGVRASKLVIEGWTPQKLIVEARWHDLVVVAKHGDGDAGGTSKLAPIPEALLASSPVPVLVADARVGPPSRLLVIFDDSPDGCRAFRNACQLALERGLGLHIVDASGARKSGEHLERARRYLADCPDLEAEFQRLEGKPAESIVSHIRENEIQLTFLAALDHSFSGHKILNRIAAETSSSLIVPKGQVPVVN